MFSRLSGNRTRLISQGARFLAVGSPAYNEIVAHAEHTRFQFGSEPQSLTPHAERVGCRAVLRALFPQRRSNGAAEPRRLVIRHYEDVRVELSGV